MPSPLILDIDSLGEAVRDSLSVLIVEEIDIFVKSDSKVNNFVAFRIT